MHDLGVLRDVLGYFKLQNLSTKSLALCFSSFSSAKCLIYGNKENGFKFLFNSDLGFYFGFRSLQRTASRNLGKTTVDDQII